MQLATSSIAEFAAQPVVACSTVSWVNTTLHHTLDTLQCMLSPTLELHTCQVCETVLAGIIGRGVVSILGLCLLAQYNCTAAEGLHMQYMYNLGSHLQEYQAAFKLYHASAMSSLHDLCTTQYYNREIHQASISTTSGIIWHLWKTHMARPCHKVRRLFTCHRCGLGHCLNS